MNKRMICCKDVLTEGGEGFKLEYFLVEEHMHGGDNFGMCVYGVEVVKLGKGNAESAYADSICASKRETEEFINMVCEALVTPTTLFDVVYDWLWKKKEYKKIIPVNAI